MRNEVKIIKEPLSQDEPRHLVPEQQSTTTAKKNINSAVVNYEEVLNSAATRLVPLSEEEEAAMLSSLPQRPIANFPSEADRKRVVGCLAIIIKTMYDYHVWDPLCPGVRNEVPSKTTDCSKHSNTSCSKINSPTRISSSNVHPSTTLDLEAIDGANNSNTEMDGSFFEEMRTTHASASTCINTTDIKGRKIWRRQRKESLVDGEINNVKEFAHCHNHQNTPERNSCSGNHNVCSNSKNTKLLLYQRHRRRRHTVYQKFLEETAELLFLDQCHAIAFLPMLNSLLMEPQIVQTKKVKISSSNLNSQNNFAVGSDADCYHPGKQIDRDLVIKRGASNEENDCLSTGSSFEQEDLISFEDCQGEFNTVSPGSGAEKVDVFDTFASGAGTNADSSTATCVENSFVEGETYNDGLLNTIENNVEQTIPLQTWDRNDLMQPFVESLTPGAGFQCVALLLVNHLLRSGHGYDARIRHVIKKLAVVVIVHELRKSDSDDENGTSSSEKHNSDEDFYFERAARKFEAMEHSIAIKLLRISAVQHQKEQAEKEKAKGQIIRTRRSHTITRDAVLRGLKVGSIGMAAGALFAVTGGIAAPGIVAALTASGITMATTLTSTAAVGTIFGVGGGGLVAYKTHRRTRGLTDFLFQYEKKGTGTRRKSKKDSQSRDAELFTTVCISGWLKDTTDFQRPWGVTPTNPSIDRAEKLARFYSVYRPENVHRSQDILKKWRGDERRLWSILAQKYGRDPDHLLPLTDGPRIRASLTHEEDEILGNLLAELGFASQHEESEEASGSLSDILKKKHLNGRTDYSEASNSSRNETPTKLFERSCESCNFSGCDTSQNQPECQEPNTLKKTPKNLITSAWDYHAEYGGELYTVRWESDLLIELCDSVSDMAVDLAGNAAKEILKQTALASLITAIAMPYALIRAANMIDGTWTLAIERADLAGIELARSLLESSAGHRPVVLVGFSMGARTIYACLKELARHQELWEDQEEDGNRQKDKAKKRCQKSARNDDVVYTREPASIVEDAILMGTPNHMSHQSWRACRCIVAGRLVNCYSKHDLILSLMFQINRLSGGLRPVCGTSAVGVPGVENYDVSPLITGHSDYCTMVPYILRMVRHGQPHRPTSTIIYPDEVLDKNVTTPGVS